MVLPIAFQTSQRRSMSAPPPSTGSSEDIAIRRCGRALDAANFRLIARPMQFPPSDGAVVNCILWPPTPPPSFPGPSSASPSLPPTSLPPRPSSPPALLPSRPSRPPVPLRSRPSRPPPYARGCPVGWGGCRGECSGCVSHPELLARQLERELGFARFSSIPRCSCPPRWNRAITEVDGRLFVRRPDGSAGVPLNLDGSIAWDYVQ